MTINVFSNGDWLGNCCLGILLLMFFVLLGYAWRYGTLLAERDAAKKNETTGGDAR